MCSSWTYFTQVFCFCLFLFLFCFVFFFFFYQFKNTVVLFCSTPFVVLLYWSIILTKQKDTGSLEVFTSGTQVSKVRCQQKEVDPKYFKCSTVTTNLWMWCHCVPRFIHAVVCTEYLIVKIACVQTVCERRWNEMDSNLTNSNFTGKYPNVTGME